MPFKRIPPPIELNDIVECYWIAENDNPEPITEKIIPDGFPELIFHYGDPYMIYLQEKWELQGQKLFAGQITSHFHLRNTGISRIIGAKLKPTAPAQLYHLQACDFTDKVVDMAEITGMATAFTAALKSENYDPGITITNLNEHFIRLRPMHQPGMAEKAVDMIFAKHGMITIAEICSNLFITERQLERIFRQYVGLSPKFYARIIRFNYIFEHVQKKDNSWSDIVHEAGFYDQSHFIRNFKAFTGEEPSAYLFNKDSMANFFLKKKRL